MRIPHSSLVCFLLLAAGYAGGANAGQPEAQGSAGLARAVIQEINRVRTNPQAYAASLEALRPCFVANRMLKFPGEPAVRTQEGVRALDDAILTLRRTAPVPALVESSTLAVVAQILADDQTRVVPTQRMARYGTELNRTGENVSYGPRSAQRIVAMLLIDDGVVNRAHRRNILDENFYVAAASIGNHSVLGTVCVIDFASAMAAP
jgi:uncharacterized protein YkwD